MSVLGLKIEEKKERAEGFKVLISSPHGLSHTLSPNGDTLKDSFSVCVS